MNVLCFADTRFPIERANGVQTMETCHALARRGHRVTLRVRPDSTTPPRDPFAFYDLPPVDQLTVQPITAAGPPGLRRVQFLLNAIGAARGAQDGVVLTRDLGLAAWLMQLPKSRRPRVVYESHGVADVVAAEMAALLGKAELDASSAKRQRLARREERVWARAAGYITITQTLADELTQRFGARDNLRVVPDGARLIPVPHPPAEGRCIAGYAGHLYPWKGVDVFLRALALLPDVHGLIVGGHPGEPDLARVRALANELGLASRVTITGLLPRREVSARLALASVLVLPNTATAISERYTSPLKLFEYLALSRPIVASDLPALREVLTHNETALLAAAGDANALAAAIDRVRRDPALANSLAARARALAPNYTWDARAERLEAALEAAKAS